MKADKDLNRKQAQYLRQQGYSFGQIANELNISKSTVKSWCYRAQEDVPKESNIPSISRCPQCGNALPPSKYKPRRFCSASCRTAYWATHSEQIHRQSTISTICPVCHKAFQHYEKHRRKYCCHACYIADRYHGGHIDDN